MITKFRLLWVVAIIVLSILACNLPFLGNSQPEEEPVAVSTEAVEDLENNLQNSQESLETSGEVTLTFTESQLTSLVAFELADLPDSPIQDVQIRLREGQVKVSGQVQQGDVYLPMNVTFELMASNGKLDYEIVSAKIGILPLPEDMIRQFTSQFDEIFTTYVESETSNLYIESVRIQNGEMVLKGHQR